MERTRQGEIRVRTISRRKDHGRKVVALKIGEGLTVANSITILRIDNGSHGQVQLLIDAPLTIPLGNAEAVSLTS